jgi:hypothetical protein
MACVGVVGLLAAGGAQSAETAALVPCSTRDPSPGWCGDGGPATSSRLAAPEAVAVTRDGGFLIADSRNHVVRRVSPSGIITRVAGIGSSGSAGDGGPATAAQLRFPRCVAETSDGGFLIRDFGAIRHVSPRGIIESVAGPDPCSTRAPLPGGGYLVADPNRNVIVRVSRSGVTSVVAGTGECGYSGDGGRATQAELAEPSSVAVTADGGFLIADRNNELVRRVSATGVITTVAGANPPLTMQCGGASGSYVPPSYVQLRLPLQGRAYRRVTITYETTYPIAVVVTIRRGSRQYARLTGHAGPGLRSSSLPVSLPPGTYSLELSGRGVAIGEDDQQEPFTRRDREPLRIVW